MFRLQFRQHLQSVINESNNAIKQCEAINMASPAIVVISCDILNSFRPFGISAFVSHSKIAHYYSIDDETPQECSMGTLKQPHNSKR
jgi:hypothetical protein